MDYASGKRCRGGAPKVFVAGTFNCSGDPQLLRVTEHLQGRKFQGARLSALMTQEHHFVSSQMVDAQFRYRSRGWNFRGAAALCPTGEAGAHSAGVATLVRSHVQDGPPTGSPHDNSPVDGQGRLTCT